MIAKVDALTMANAFELKIIIIAGILFFLNASYLIFKQIKWIKNRCTTNYSGERCAKKCSTNSSEYIKPTNKSLSINLESVVLGFSIALILCILSIALYYIVKFKFVCKFYDSLVNKSFKFNRFDRNDSDDGNNGRNNRDETYSNNTTNNARTNVVRFARESHDSVGFTSLIDYDRDSSVWNF